MPKLYVKAGRLAGWQKFSAVLGRYWNIYMQADKGQSEPIVLVTFNFFKARGSAGWRIC
jgi:hypothetical protein